MRQHSHVGVFLLATVVGGVLATTGSVALGEGEATVHSDDTGRDAAVERARSAADALTRELKSRLVAEMTSGGPSQAVRVCSEVAPEVAASHTGEGISVRRVSLKVRNPIDAPDPFERMWLEKLESLRGEGKMPEEVVEIAERADGGNELRYLRPILVAAPCLSCHGPVQSLSPEVREILAERYPEDAAVGYSSGDLRGAVSVRVDLP